MKECVVRKPLEIIFNLKRGSKGRVVRKFKKPALNVKKAFNYFKDIIKETGECNLYKLIALERRMRDPLNN